MLRREDGQYHGLVIGRGQPRIWSLPKGHVEPHERVEDAATREVFEETGIEAQIVAKLSDIRYWFYSSSAKHSKVVHFFLMRYVAGSLAPQVGEVDEVAWAPLADLNDTLTHENERNLVDLARSIVEEKSATELGF